MGSIGDPFYSDPSLVGPQHAADLLRDRLLRGHRALFLRIPPVAAPAPDSRYAVLEDPQRCHGHGGSQRPGCRAVHDGRARHSAPLLLLPDAGLGMETEW